MPIARPNKDKRSNVLPQEKTNPLSVSQIAPERLILDQMTNAPQRGQLKIVFVIRRSVSPARENTFLDVPATDELTHATKNTRTDNIFRDFPEINGPPQTAPKVWYRVHAVQKRCCTM